MPTELDRRNGYQPFEQISSKHYRYTPGEAGYRLDLSRVWQDKYGVHGRLKIYQLVGQDAWACKHFEDGNLSTKAFYKAFVDTTREINAAQPWLRWLQQFLLQTVEAIDRPTPLLRVEEIPLTTETGDYIPDLVLAEVPNLLWAQGGTGKSWLGAWVAMCIATETPWLGHKVRQGNVLYYDWEAGPAAFRRRIDKVAQGLGVGVPANLHYRYCTGALTGMEETFASDLYEHGIQVVLVDALGGAEGEKREFSDSRDGIMGIFSLLRAHRVTSLLIDHVAGDGLKSPRDVVKPYGSVYKLNQARNAWMLLREPSAEGRIIPYQLEHKKVNEGMLNDDGYAYELDGTTLGAVQFHARESSKVRQALWVAQMDGLLCTRPASVTEIRAVTGQSEDAIKKYLQRHGERYEGMQTRGKATLWRLRDGVPPMEREVPW